MQDAKRVMTQWHLLAPPVWAVCTHLASIARDVPILTADYLCVSVKQLGAIDALL